MARANHCLSKRGALAYILFGFLPLLDILTLHSAVFQMRDPQTTSMTQSTFGYDGKSGSEIRLIEGNDSIPSSSPVSELD